METGEMGTNDSKMQFQHNAEISEASQPQNSSFEEVHNETHNNNKVRMTNSYSEDSGVVVEEDPATEMQEEPAAPLGDAEQPSEAAEDSPLEGIPEFVPEASASNEDKDQLMRRGRFVGRFSDKKNPAVKRVKRMETVDPPIPKPDASSVMFNLSSMSMKVLGSGEQTLVPGFDPNNQGAVSWQELRMGFNPQSAVATAVQKKDGTTYFNVPAAAAAPSLKMVTGAGGDALTAENEWNLICGGDAAAAAAVTAESNHEDSLDEWSENRLAEPDDHELATNPDEEGALNAEALPWVSDPYCATAQPLAGSAVEQQEYYYDQNYIYPTGSTPHPQGGEYTYMLNEINEIGRQIKLLNKLPEQIKKMQREVQEIEKTVKMVYKNVTKDPQEEPGRTQDVNPARHTERLVSVPPGTQVLVLSDSICNRMNGYKISSDRKVQVKSYGGLTVTEMITIVSTMSEEVTYDIEYVFLHVGTNDLGFEDLPLLKSEFKSLIKKSLKIFSNAIIFMSAILPRYGSPRELKDRSELNTLMEVLAEKHKRVQFIDASNEFIEHEVDNTLRGDLFKRDYTHLTLKGMGVLANAFKRVLDHCTAANEGGITGFKNVQPCIPSTGSSMEGSSEYQNGLTSVSPGPKSAYGANFVPPATGYQFSHSSETNGFGDRNAVTPSPVMNGGRSHYGMTGGYIAGSTVPVNGPQVNPQRQRISGRYTQYRR